MYTVISQIINWQLRLMCLCVTVYMYVLILLRGFYVCAAKSWL